LNLDTGALPNEAVYVARKNVQLSVVGIGGNTMSVSLRPSGAVRLIGRMLSILAIVSWLLQSSIGFTRSASAASIYPAPNIVAASQPPLQKSYFTFEIAPDFGQVDGAELIYLTPSAQTSAGIRRSINGGAAFGGLLQEASFINREIVEPISAGLLRRGRNSVVFMPNDFGEVPEIKMVRLQLHTIDRFGKRGTQIISPIDTGIERFRRPVNFVPDQRPLEHLVSTIDVKEIPTQVIDIAYPMEGSFFGDRALVRGAIRGDAAKSGFSLTIAGRLVPHEGGTFEAINDRPDVLAAQGAWSVDVAIALPDGRKMSRTVTLTRSEPDAYLSRATEKTVDLGPGRPAETAFGAKIRLASRGEGGQVLVRCNRFVDTPAATEGLLNVTAEPCASYRIQRLGNTGPLAVEIPSRLANLPNGFREKQAKSFRYSEPDRVWIAMAESFVDIDNKSTMTTLRDQTATIVSGVLKDDSAVDRAPTLRDPSAIQSLSEINVLGGHVRIEPPEANPQGSAQLTMPILMRPQRGKLGRLFGLTYDSNAGPALAGQGWTLDVPIIAVDTKWGVPAYNPTKETESYLFSGRELVAFEKDDDVDTGNPYLAPRMQLKDRAAFLRADSTTEFRLRRDDTYDRIIRHGENIGNYWWEVIRKDGVREFFGYDPKSGAIVANAVRKTPGGAAFQWARTRIIDLDGHTAEYDWNDSGCNLIGGCVSSLQLQNVRYNAHLPSDDGQASETRVHFEWSTTRNDRIVSARFGALQVTESLLTKITTEYGPSYASFYGQERFRFKQSPFGKSLLSEVVYEVAPKRTDPNVISDDDLIDHQCSASPAKQWTLEAINKAGNTKKAICFRYHDPLSDTEPGAVAAKPFQDVKEASASKIDGTMLDGAFGLFKGIASPLGSASILGTNTSNELGGSLYLGFALPAAKDFSVGVKTGSTERSSDGRSVLVDMTGDGIPDLVLGKGDKLEICEGKRQGGGVVYASNCLSAQNVPNSIMKENGSSFSIGAEVFFEVGFAGAALTEGSSARTAYFTDVDGDGLTDIVDQGTVHFNQGRQDNDILFAPTSRNVRSLSAGAGNPAIANQVSELGKSFDAQRTAAAKNRKYAPLIDVVQTWRAPFNGAIMIGGNFITIPTPDDASKPDEISTKPDDVKGAARLSIERSRGGSVKPCFSAPLASGDVPLNCFENPGEVTAQPQDILSTIPTDQPAPLLVRVQEGDIIYARMSSQTDAKTPWADLDLFVSYLSYDPSACKEPANQRPFDCGSRWERTKEVLKDVQAEPDASKKLAVLRAGLAICDRTWPVAGSGKELDASNSSKICDASARQPNYWSLGQDAVQAGQLADAIVLPQTGVAVFSGAVAFPNGTAPLRITLVGRPIPAAANDEQDLRLSLEPADQTNAWTSKIFSLVVAGKCSGATFQGQAVPAPSRVECSASGDRIIVQLASASFQPQGQLVRLEVSEINDPKLFESQDTGKVDWATLVWDIAPRVVVTPDAPVGNPPVNGIDSAALVDLNRIPSVLMLSPYLRNRFFLDVAPATIGIGTIRKQRQQDPGDPNSPMVYYDDPFEYGRSLIQSERRFIRSASGAASTNFRNLIDNESNDSAKVIQRTERFDPLVAAKGFLLPGGCEPSSITSCTYEYRLAHVFSTLGPKLSSGSSDNAFAFDVDVLLNGKRVRLRNLGQIKPNGCKGEDTTEELDPIRPVDCVVSGAATPTGPVTEQIGASFYLTDRNEVTGRDQVYAFDGHPGDVLQILVHVRALWNANIKDYASCQNTSCTQKKPRKVDKLFEHACLNPNDYPGGCTVTAGPWLPLKTTELRLGLKGTSTSIGVISTAFGLNLANKGKRFDVVRLSVPLSYQEDYHELKVLDPAFDYRGWSRFAVRANAYNDNGDVVGPVKTPPFGNVRAEGATQVNPHKALIADLTQKANSVSNCNGTNPSCRQTIRDAVDKADKRQTYPMSMRFLDPLPSYTSAKAWCDAFGAANPSICQSWLTKATYGEQADLPGTCGRPLKGTIVPCFIGPNEKIWIRLPAASATTQGLRQAGAHRGPEELGLTESGFSIDAFRRMTPSATSILAPPLASTTTSWSATLGTTGANGGLLTSHSSNQSNYLDLNGDGYPDPIINGVAFLTGPNGLPRANWLADGQFGGIAKSSDFNQASIGGGSATTAISAPYANGASDSTQSPTGDASRGPQVSEARPTPVGQQAGPEARLSPGFGLSFAAAESVPDEDLVDLNGDGLPDAIKFNGSQLGTKINLGQQFVTAGTIDAHMKPGGGDLSGSLGFNLGWKTSSGSYGGGLSLSHNNSMSHVTLVDINGDGLVDALVPDGKGALKVAFNNGWGFQQPISIPLPDFKFPDTGASETSIAGIGGHFSYYPGPLCWPTPFCFVVINPAFSKTDTLGRNLVSMLDLNGDGLIDFASTDGFYVGGDPSSSLFSFPSGGAQQKIKTHLNNMGKGDKLKTIINPTGSAIGLEYALFGNEGIRNPKAVWALSEGRFSDGFRATNEEKQDQDVLVSTLKYSDGVFDRAERRFLGFETISKEMRGCPDERSQLLSSVALSGRCVTAETKFLRRVVQTFDNRSVYTFGLPLDEFVTGENEKEIVQVSSNAYALVPEPEGKSPLTGDLHDPYAACEANASDLANEALDELCIKAYRKRLKDNVEFREINAVDQKGNTANEGRWKGLRLSPQLKVVRKNVQEETDRKLRSLVLYEHDTTGNIVAMVDFGHVRNPTDAPDDDRDDYRADVKYLPIEPSLREVNKALLGKLGAANVSDRPSQFVARKGARFDAGAKVLRARSVVYEPQGVHVKTSCRLLSADLQPEELASELCKRLSEASFVGEDPGSLFEASVRKAGFAADDVIMTRVFYDIYGNPLRTLTPFNHQGDWIDRRFSYDRDPFRQRPSFIGEGHCLYRSAGRSPSPTVNRNGDLPNDLCTFDDQARAPRVQISAWHVSRASYEDLTGEMNWDADLNGNALFYEHDGWGRLRSVLSNWDRNAGDRSFIAPEARTYFDDKSALCASDKTIPCPTAVMMHVAYQDHRLDSFSPWQARVTRYVDRALYAGHSPQNAMTIEAVNFVDGLNRPVRTARSADVCDDSTIDDMISSKANISLGWCSTASVRVAIASGKIVRNALGAKLAEYYPWNIPLSSTTAASFAGFTSNKYLDWVFAGAAPTDLARTAYEVDIRGRVLEASFPDGNKLRINHTVATDQTAAGTETRFKTTIVDSRCAATQYTRDARGLIVAVLEDQEHRFPDDPDKPNIKIKGRQKAECDGAVTVARMLEEALAVEASQPDGTSRFAESQYVYDPMAQLTDIIFERKRGSEAARIKVAYDNLGRCIRTSDPDRGVENIQYDRMGNVRLRDYSPLIGSNAGQTKTVLQQFDANRVVATRYPASPELDVRYRYDGFDGFDFHTWSLSGWKAADTFGDEIGKSCDNCIGRLVATQDRSGLVAQDYDVYGKPRSQWKSFVVGETERGLFSIRKEYDIWGVLKSQRVRELEPQKAADNCYGGRDNRFICDFDETVRYAYNRAGQLHRIDHDNTAVARFAYDAFGALGAKWTNDGTTTRYVYDPVDRRLSTLTTRLFDGTAIQNVTYDYDPGGNIRHHLNDALSGGGETFKSNFNYTYDAANRVTSLRAKIEDSAANVNLMLPTEVYGYDTLNRIKSVKVGSLLSEYKYADEMGTGVIAPLHAPRLIEAGKDGSESRSLFHYDDWGNLVKANHVDGKGRLDEQRVLRWDTENRLSAVTVTRANQADPSKNGTIEASYVYDRSGGRSAKIAPRVGEVGSAEQREINLYVTDILSRRWGDNTAALHFSYENKPLGSLRLAKTGQDTERYAYFYHSELPNGSTSAVTRPAGSSEFEGELIERVEYKPFGGMIERPRVVGPIASGSAGISNKLALLAGDATADRRLPFYAYSGKEYDLETGYIYFGARYYDSKNAVWISADPLQTKQAQRSSSALSAYLFALGNPLANVDRDGREAIPNSRQAQTTALHFGDRATELYYTNNDLIVTQPATWFAVATFGDKVGGLFDISAFLHAESKNWKSIRESSSLLLNQEVPLPKISPAGSLFTVDKQVGAGINIPVPIGIEGLSVEPFVIGGGDRPTSVGAIGGVGVPHIIYGGIGFEKEVELGGKAIRAAGSLEQNILRWISSGGRCCSTGQ
jgi:RHS repeat-associated protein